MPKKDTKLVQLSEKVHIAVEEMKNRRVENTNIPIVPFQALFTDIMSKGKYELYYNDCS